MTDRDDDAPVPFPAWPGLLLAAAGGFGLGAATGLGAVPATRPWAAPAAAAAGVALGVATVGWWRRRVERSAQAARRHEAAVAGLARLRTDLEARASAASRTLAEHGLALEAARAERDESERQALQTEKMASLGRMAAGVAHEFNNPAQHLLVNLPFLRRGIERLRGVLDVALAHPPEDAAALARVRRAVDEAKLGRTNADLDEILAGLDDGATKISELVRDLTTFARLDSAEWKEVDLHEGLDAAIRLLGYRWKDRVAVHRDYGVLPRVRCHAGQVNHVFMNLLANAADAIGDRGNVWIKTEPTTDGVRVRVTDDGAGMAPEVLARVFDPFFTTKEPGQGTGLGLTTAFEIVRRHGGTMTARSDPGIGTVFTVELPVAGAEATR